MKSNVEETNANSDAAENERNLIRQAKEGHQWAFTQLVSLYQKPLFRMAYGFFRDKDDAMEIVQDAFLRVYRKIEGFDETDPRAQFKNWVYRIAHNLCIDHYRKYKKQKAEMSDIFQHNEDIRGDSGSPEEAVDRETFRENLKLSVLRLPNRQKSVFTLKHYDGLKHHEIAEILNLSVGTVKSLYHRAIQNLKKHLVPESVAVG